MEIIDTKKELNKPMYFRDVLGMFRVVSTAPSGTPKSAQDQIVIYTSGSTYRLYWFDTTAGVWHYVTASA